MGLWTLTKGDFFRFIWISSSIYGAAMPKYIPKICIVMLLIGIAPLPIGYYMLLRFVACGTFALGALIAYERNHQSITIYYGMMALLFNPFFPIEHAKVMWIVFDIVAAGLLLATSKQVTKESNLGEPPLGS
jgi:hypothetical protein